MIKNKNTSPLIPVATAITIVAIIDSTYTIEGIILCFFIISFKWPLGVDKKQLPEMFNICPIE